MIKRREVVHGWQRWFGSLSSVVSTALLIAGVAAGYAQPSRSHTTRLESMNSPVPLRFLALGDSYTIGESVSVAERWPVQLVHMAKREGLTIEEPVIVAKTGWTTDELSDAMDKADLQGAYDIVTLLIGVNNQYRGRSEEEYRHQFKDLLAHAIVLAGGRRSHVIVLSIPDWGVTPFAEGRDRKQISAHIDRFNAINNEESQHANAQYVDITPVSRSRADDVSLIAHDGLHPSGKMYEQWARLVLPVLRGALRGK